MRTFNCDPDLGLLKDDYTQLCPSTQDFTFWWSWGFCILYPIGIPIFMHSACVFLGMHGIVEEKLDAANFRAMLSAFLHRGVSIEASRFARLVGNCTPERFRMRADEEYDKLIKVLGQGEFIELNWPDQKSHGDSHSELHMEGTSIKEIVNFMRKYDDDGNGKVDRIEFRTMLKKSQEIADLFTGSETLDRLTDRQMETLLLYEDWPKPHEGAQDAGKNGNLDDSPGIQNAHDPGLGLKEAEKTATIAPPTWYSITQGKLNQHSESGEVFLQLVRNKVAGQPATSLTVHIIEARKLKAMDLQGSSDPYITIHLGNDEGKPVKSEQVSTKICKKTLNPMYDQFF